MGWVDIVFHVDFYFRFNGIVIYKIFLAHIIRMFLHNPGKGSTLLSNSVDFKKVTFWSIDYEWFQWGLLESFQRYIDTDNTDQWYEKIKDHNFKGLNLIYQNVSEYL